MTVYIGMDVHSTSYTLNSYTMDGKSFGNVQVSAKYQNVVKYIERMKEKLGKDTEFICGYEAGCLGYTLYKDLTNVGIQCIILAPTTMPSTSKEIKTDKRDAIKISQCLAYGTYSPVYVPDEKDQETKEYIRMRDDHKTMLKKTKQQILAFCLRNGYVFTGTKSNWTQKHIEWLKTIKITPTNRMILDGYLLTFDHLTERLKEMDAQIEEMSNDERYKEGVKKLECLAGISVHKALSFIVETSDFKRFNKAEQFSSYIGLVPGEASSGNSVKRLGITKAGNRHMRKLAVEAAHAIGRTKGTKSKLLKQRQSGNSKEIIEYADKANRRLRKKYLSLTISKNKNIAATAVARELMNFVWGLMTNHIN